jgi:hypothetical protein
VVYRRQLVGHIAIRRITDFLNLPRVNEPRESGTDRCLGPLGFLTDPAAAPDLIDESSELPCFARFDEYTAYSILPAWNVAYDMSFASDGDGSRDRSRIENV